MSYIYSFLQKRKMHENQHGIIMVIIAYVLSILMLVLGSDVFYNINTAAAGINTETEEETHDLLIHSLSEDNSANQSSLLLKSELLNPYNLPDISDISINTDTVEAVTTGEETVWFLGSAMDTETFDLLMGKLDSIVAANIAKQESDKKADKETAKASDKASDKAEETINSYSVKVASGDTVITITEEDVAMLQRIVESEAEGEDMIGKILIANVIFNRIVDEDFPDTVEDVIFQKVDGDYQFSPVASDRYWSVKISSSTKKAVKRALEGEDYSKGALYFVARRRTSSESAQWFDNNLKWLFKHGGHEFYKNK